MSFAWETTDEDVMNVLRKRGVNKSSGEVDTIMGSLDHGKIEKAALRGDDMDEQTRYAYEEIAEQLTAANIIPS